MIQYTLHPQSQPFFNYLHANCNKEVLKILNLKRIHFDVYVWICRYISARDKNGNPICEYIIKGGVYYFWVCLKKIMSEFGIKDENTIKFIVARLQGKKFQSKKKKWDVHGVPFFTITIPNPGCKGSRTFFTVNKYFGTHILPENLNQKLFKGLQMSAPSLVEVPADLAPNKIAEPIQKIINSLLENKHGIFRHRVDYNKPTKLIQRVATHIQNIYNGMQYEYYARNISPEFKERNEINETHASKLKVVAGNWELVRRLVIKTYDNYALWFDERYLPEKKDWLPKKLDDWFYSAFNQQSIFLACLVEPEPLRELYIDRVFNSLPAVAQSIGNSYYDKQLNAMAYWKGLKEVVEFFSIVSKLGGKGYATGTIQNWMPSIKIFLNKYFEFLFARGIPYNNQLGVDSPTFRLWVDMNSGDDIEPPLEYYNKNRKK